MLLIKATATCDYCKEQSCLVELAVNHIKIPNKIIGYDGYDAIDLIVHNQPNPDWYISHSETICPLCRRQQKGFRDD